MNRIPDCPEELPGEITQPLHEFAAIWEASDLRPKPDQEVLDFWDSLVIQWANSEDLPLFIRKASSDRGQETLHASGRKLVPVDNSPAHWAFIQALAEYKPHLEDIDESLSKDKIPVAMVLKKNEKFLAKYKCKRKKQFNLNASGWKLAHIEPVGLNGRGPITQRPIEALKQQFVRLMSPSNMFLVPLKLGGLAEISIVIDEMKNQ